MISIMIFHRRSITATLGGIPPVAAGEDLSIGSAGSLAARQTYQPAEWTSAQSGDVLFVFWFEADPL